MSGEHLTRRSARCSASEPSKAKMSMRNQLELRSTNLAEIYKMSTSKVWASGNGTRGQPTRGIISLRKQNSFRGERRVRRLILLLLDGRLVERRRINSKRTCSWTRRGWVVSFRIGRGDFLAALGDTLQQRYRCIVRIAVRTTTGLIDLRWRNTISSRSGAVCW